MPRVGAQFKTFEKKSAAEEYARELREAPTPQEKNTGVGVPTDNVGSKKIIPIVLKADVAGSLEAIEKEINKIKNDSAQFRIISRGTGPISERDMKGITQGENAIVIGFNVKTDKSAAEIAERAGITISQFNIIYKMTEWLAEEMEKRRPRVETEETMGKAKILKAFSRTKERAILGGKVLEGKISLGSIVKIVRREFEIGKGKIVNLEKSKEKVTEVESGSEFGMLLESKIEVVGGDVIESFSVVHK
jgi:translation initiation factor IF-2